MAITSTTLGAAAGANDTIITVASATGIAAPVPNTGVLNILQIEQEYLYVTGVTGTAVNVQRGYNGTIAAAHASGQQVLIAAVQTDFTPLGEVFKNLVVTGAQIQGENLGWTYLTGSADALTGAAGTFIINTAGVDAITLPTATAAMEGNVINLWSNTAQAHTLTVASATLQVGVAKTIGTFAAVIGNGLTLRAHNLKWYVVADGAHGTNSAVGIVYT